MKGKVTSVLILLTFLLFGGTGYAQLLVPKKCYMHLVGSINKSYSAEMNLVKLNDTLYAEYSFIPTENFSHGLTDSGKVISVSGRMRSADAFILTETAGGMGSTFSGKFLNGQAVGGTYTPSAEVKPMPFEFTERYPEGSIPLNAWFQKASMPLLKKPKSPAAAIQLGLLLPGESANPLISDSLRQLLLTKFTGKPVHFSDPNRIIDGIKQVYFENYLGSNEGIYNESMNSTFNWESLEFMHVLLNGAHLLSVYIDHYAFTGGAHGLQTKQFTVINLWTGKEVALNELFGGNRDAELTEIITRKIREMKQAGPSQNLKDLGFYTNEIKPSENFYVTRQGIGFFFNQYDIAPYVAGPMDVFISFSEMRNIVGNSVVLRELIK